MTNENNEIEARMERFQQEMMPFEVEDICLHTPDCLKFIGEYQEGDIITQSFCCECGKLVREIYHLTKTETFEY